MGILLLINQAVRHENATWGTVVFHFGLPYLSISMSLNILLTLMIIIRLALHIRDVRIAMGGPDGIGGLYKTVVTMLIESCALYTMSSFLVIGSWVSGDHSTIIFFNILTQIQVRAFPQPRSLEFSNAATDWTGHCSTTHHPASCRQECVDERYCRLRTSRFVQS